MRKRAQRVRTGEETAKRTLASRPRPSTFANQARQLTGAAGTVNAMEQTPDGESVFECWRRRRECSPQSGLH